MKVYALRCGHGHDFEGWFGSDGDFADQQDRELIVCPWCSDKAVARVPSAPRLNLSGAREPQQASKATDVVAAPPSSLPAMQAAWLQMVKKVVDGTEDVGTRFPDEARRIHYGEIDPRAIRGQATEDERAALASEGIEVLALPLPDALKGPMH